MANSELKPIHVPMLRAKLGGVLYMFSRRIKTDTAFGQAFAPTPAVGGLSDRAIRNWITGYNQTNGADYVPGERFSKMVEIFMGELPGERTYEEVSALLTSNSPAALLHAFAEGQPKEGWMALVAKAGRAEVRLVAEMPPGRMGLTGRGNQFTVTNDWTRAKAKQWFRFEIDPGRGWLAAIQWGPEGWYAMPLGEGLAVVSRQDTKLRAPIKRPYLIENEAVARRYFFLQSCAPFAPFLAEILDTSACAPAPLDAATLTRLASMKTHTSSFNVTSLDVAFHD